METEAPRFFGRPALWLLFAGAVLATPFAAWVVRESPSWTEIHPALNAMLNGASAMCLLMGFHAIRNQRREVHATYMLSAFAFSSVFLISYLLRYATTGTHNYPGGDWDKVLYLVVLFSHMILAIVVVPLVLSALFFAKKQKFAKHRRVARWLLPIWLYVSVTGVAVYFMLYHLGPRLAG